MSFVQYCVVGLCLALIGLAVFLLVRVISRMGKGGCPGCPFAFDCRGCTTGKTHGGEGDGISKRRKGLLGKGE